MTSTHQIQLNFDNTKDVQALFGPNDVHLKTVESVLDVSIVTRGEKTWVKGSTEPSEMVSAVLNALQKLVSDGMTISERDVVYAIQLAQQGLIEQLFDLFHEEITVNSKGKPIRVKTIGQRHYV